MRASTATASYRRDRPPSPNTHAAMLYEQELLLQLKPEDIGAQHVNWLISFCNIVRENPMTQLSQCSSSLFAVMFQRLLGYRIGGLHLEPNTAEKKEWNMKRVLEETSAVINEDLLLTIRPAEVVRGNELQIATLVQVFLHIALHLLQEARTNDAIAEHIRDSAEDQEAVPDDEEGEQYSNGQQSTNAEEALVVQDLEEQAPPAPPSTDGTSTNSLGKYGGGRQEEPVSVEELTTRHRRRRASKGRRQPFAAAQQHRAADDASSAGGHSIDAMAFTTELVNDWDMEIVRPPKRAHGALVDPLSVAEVQHRIHQLADRVAQLPSQRASAQRPTCHDSRQRVATFSADRLLERMAIVRMRNFTRDTRILQIRNERFVDGLQDVLRREAVKQQSVAEQSALRQFKTAVKHQKRDALAQEKQVREADDAYRRATEAIALSERNRLKLTSDVASDETARLSKASLAAAREARRVLNAKAQEYRHSLHDHNSSIASHRLSWRRECGIAQLA